MSLGYGRCAMAQDGKGIRFWNLTMHTITSFRMSPAGENRWGPDQCRNDRDGTVEHLIPATKDAVVEVDIAGGRVVVADWLVQVEDA